MLGAVTAYALLHSTCDTEEKGVGRGRGAGWWHAGTRGTVLALQVPPAPPWLTEEGGSGGNRSPKRLPTFPGLERQDHPLLVSPWHRGESGETVRCERPQKALGSAVDAPRTQHPKSARGGGKSSGSLRPIPSPTEGTVALTAELQQEGPMTLVPLLQHCLSRVPRETSVTRTRPCPQSSLWRENGCLTSKHTDKPVLQVRGGPGQGGGDAGS